MRCNQKIRIRRRRYIQERISEAFKTGDAIAIIKWKEIYEKYEKAINKCEDCVNLIEEILIESASPIDIL